MQRSRLSQCLCPAPRPALGPGHGQLWPVSVLTFGSAAADRVSLFLCIGRLIGVPGRAPRGAETAVLGWLLFSGPVLTTGRLMGVPGIGLRAITTPLQVLIGDVVLAGLFSWLLSVETTMAAD